MDLNKLCYFAHRMAVEKGWHDNGDPPIPEQLMLIVTELAEAMEEYRNGHNLPYEKDGKPEGFPIEIADAVIRIAHLCGAHGIDLNDAVNRKLKYNATRPRRHGGKVC